MELYGWITVQIFFIELGFSLVNCNVFSFLTKIFLKKLLKKVVGIGSVQQRFFCGSNLLVRLTTIYFRFGLVLILISLLQMELLMSRLQCSYFSHCKVFGTPSCLKKSYSCGRLRLPVMLLLQVGFMGRVAYNLFQVQAFFRENFDSSD